MGAVIYTDGNTMLSDQGTNEDTVEFLERLLQKAKDGEIVGVCAAVQYADRSTGDGNAGFFWNAPMIGGLTKIIHRLVNE
ncbi:hypothetical protein [Neorhizobium sp. AL 9.2.2]|uniref:hypothetical protein n=1 Tax=Neorhizobium sp. AL 9.2.2 TaxID=2712894 RepID=UPI001573C354|nr:hypothetical protein [Neorhizobium sp. AL 9.2.2]NSY17256.1 hypothetical protein [Neorhizobium sp. AL 9.2.2]